METQDFRDRYFSEEAIRFRQEKAVKQRLLVWYGISKQNKIRKKRGICIIFLNDRHNTLEYYEFRVRRFMDICYVREQTDAEKTDAAYSTRIFTSYEKFLDEKPYNGNWDGRRC